MAKEKDLWVEAQKKALLDWASDKNRQTVKLEEPEPPTESKAAPKKPRVKKPPKQSETDKKRFEEYEAKLIREQVAEWRNPQSTKQRKSPVSPVDYSRFDEIREYLVQLAVTGEMIWPYLIWGNIGVGKSCLASAIYEQWSGTPQWPGTAHWYRYSDFCRYCSHLKTDRQLSLQSSDGAFREYSYDTWWNRHLANTGLVVIDDLGMGDVGNERNEFIFNLLEVRKGKPLIFTTNSTPHEMSDNRDIKGLRELFNPQVMSRLRSGTWMDPLVGRDLRAEGAARPTAFRRNNKWCRTKRRLKYCLL